METRWAPPASFDEYRVIRPLGQGAMGQVFLLHDTLLDRAVAAKFLSGAPDLAARERFLTEARAIARLSHPNVVTIHRVGELGGQPYLISEYIEGEDLSQLPRPLPASEVLPIALGLCRGLHAAHEQGVLHRDLKPQNAMRTRTGEIKLLDFGLAKLLLEARHPAPLAAPISPSPSRDLDVAATLPRPGAGASGAQRPSPASAASPGSQTETGALLGTPRYMAPEAWRGEPATAQTDLYSLGALLYELCAGVLPHDGTTIADLREAVLAGPAPPLRERAPAIDDRFAGLIDRCLCPDPSGRPRSALELCLQIEALTEDRSAPRLPAGNPYRGLLPFSAEDRGLFFGRDLEVRALWERLQATPLVLLAGPSGVGKSSLCRAGLLPLLDGGARIDGRIYHCVTLLPGPRPLESLAEALQPLCGAAPRTDDPEVLLGRLKERLGAERGLLLFIDQMEEVVTLGAAEAERFGAIIRALTARRPQLRVVGALRGDFLTDTATALGLGAELGRALHLLGPLCPAALREAIVGPAWRLGVRFESEALIDELHAAVAPGGLPLLQFALSELWEARDRERGLIPRSALTAIGGVSGALSRHGDGVLSRLLPTQRQAARRLLCLLVGEAGTRVRRGGDELLGAPEDGAVLSALIEGRLVVGRDGDGDGRTTTSYEIAHEALPRAWPRLRTWLEESAGQRPLRARLEAAAAEWERLGRGREGLGGARLLDDLGPLSGEEAAGLPEGQKRFLARSAAELLRKRRRRGATFVAAPLLLLLLYGAFVLRARLQLRARVATHLAEAAPATRRAAQRAAAAEKHRGEAFRRFDEGRRREGEAAWAAALEATQEAHGAYGRGQRALLTALLLDGRHRIVRQRLGEALLSQALLHEIGHDLAARDELLSSLATLDEDEKLGAGLGAPARLALGVNPEGARLTLGRYEKRDGRRALVPLGERRAEGEHTLTPGSYLLVLRAPGRREVRAPVLLARGERYPLRLTLPPEGSVPPGMVYVPPGRFLYGSADSESFRDFLSAQPQHEVGAGAYLIGEHEVTFSEYLAYLRALPEAERARRRPGIKSGFGSLELTEEDGAFRLRLQPATVVLSAREGEPLRYPDRQRRAQVDWRRLPVSAVSFDDAEAYARHLRETGRLPGARLCSEHEWERAARGADGRPYPHGDRLEPEDGNHDATYGRRPGAFGPDEVGSHPASASPFGVADLSGNVWEWVRSTSGSEEVAIRGGCFYESARNSLSTNRQAGERTLRDRVVGLRLCADAPR